MSFNETTLAQARNQGASDDEIFAHLAAKDDRFRVAKEQGATLDDIATHLTTKEGEKNEVNKQSQPEAQLDSNEQRQADQQVQPSNEAGLQPSEVQLQQSQGQEQSVGNIDTNLKIDFPFQTGGEKIAKETEQATDRSQGQETGEGLRGQVPKGNEAQVSGAFGVQTPKPKEDTVLGSAYEAGLSGYKGLGNMSSQLGRYIWDLSKNVISLNADAANAIFGENTYTENVRKNILEKGDKYYADQIKGSEMSPDEAKKPLNQFVFGVGHMIGDLVLAGMTAGESAAAKGVFTLAETPAIKAVAEQAIHGMKAFAAPSLIASNEAITKAKEEGEDDASALAEGMKTLFETEAGAAFPMNVSSGLKSVLARTASRVLQATPLAVAQGELVQAAKNTYERAFGDSENIQPTISENIIEGNFETAAMQLAQSAPMGVLGAMGGNARMLGRRIAEVDLPETAVVVEEEITQQPKVRYSSEEQLLKDTTLRLNQLKAKPAEELTTGEANELEFLRGIPSVDELAAGYGVSVRKPTYSSKEIIQSRITDATTELESLSEKQTLNARETKRKTKLESEIAKNQELLDSGKTLEDETARKEATKNNIQELEKPTEPTKQNEEQIQETGGVSTEQGQPIVEATAIKAEEGTPQRQGEGKEEIVVPKTIELARSVDEAKAWGKQQIARLSKLTSASAQRERARTEAKVNQRIAELDGSNKPVVVPKTIELAKSVEEAKAWGAEKLSKLSTLKSISAKREIERTKAKVNERVAQLEKSGLDNGKPRATPKKEKPLPKKPKGTRVLAAAYKRLSDGKIFYGANHKEALLESGMPWKDIQSKYGSPSQRETPEFGYKTNSYDFVTRREAEQVGTQSKQIDVAGREADKQLGLDLHSSRISLDEFPAFKAPEFSMGAARPSEFADKKAFQATLVKATQAHESIKGELTFDKWKSAFLSGLKKGGQYTESQLKSIFQESEGLNAYAKSFGRNVEDIIDFPDLWSGKSAAEIEALSTKKRKKDINLTNDEIDALREDLKFEPIMKQEAEKWGDVWKEAMLRINSNKAEITSLIDQLRIRPRALVPVDKAILRYATLDALHALDIQTDVLASASNKIARKEANQAYEQASRKLNELLEIESRTASASGLSLNAVKLINKAFFNTASMINQYRAAKNTYNKGEGKIETELSQKELTKIREQSKALVEALKVRDEALQEAKIQEADKSISDFLESAKKDRKAGEVITDLSVDEQISQYTMEIESAGDDSMSRGVAMRGLARAISEKLNTTDVAVVSKEVNARIKDIMGKEWNENTTKDALAGNGIFGQTTKKGAFGSLRTLERRRADFEKDLAIAMKAKTQKERDLKMANLLERNRVDVKELEPQIQDLTEIMMTRISKLMGDLKNNELRPCE
jgi:hypothetical protein